MGHGLDTRHRNHARLTGLRGTVDVPVFAGEGAPVWGLPAARPAPRLKRGAERGFVAAAMDDQNRIAVTKLLPLAGWRADESLVVRFEDGRAWVRVGVAHSPLLVAARLRGWRLTLPTSVRARLDVRPGDVVVAVTAADGEVVLDAAWHVAEQMAPVVVPVEPAVDERPVARSRGVKVAWSRPVAANG